jgi:hypothetical protein
MDRDPCGNFAIKCSMVRGLKKLCSSMYAAAVYSVLRGKDFELLMEAGLAPRLEGERSIHLIGDSTFADS